jgi:glutaredoxin
MLTDANYWDKVSTGTVVVSMEIPGCPSCTELKEAMIAVEQECSGVRFERMNTATNPQTTRELQIVQVPMLFLYRDGKFKGRAIVAPVPPKERLVEWVNFRSTYQVPELLVEKPEACSFCMAVRRKLFSWLPRRIGQWLEVRYANMSWR